MIESPEGTHDSDALPKSEPFMIRAASPGETLPSPSSKRLGIINEPMSEDIAFLHKYGIGYPSLCHAETRANALNVTPASSLICSGTLSELDYFRLVAVELKLEFVPEPPQDQTPFFSPPKPGDLDSIARLLSPLDGTSRLHGFTPRTVYLAPDCRQMEAIKKLIFSHPELAARLRITTLSANRQALIARCSPALLHRAINRLSTLYSKFSAKTTLVAKQAVALVIIGQVIAVLSFFSSGAVLLVLHLLASCFYIGCVSLRLIAVFSFKRVCSDRGEPPLIQQNVTGQLLPDYSILIALNQEAGQVEDLIDSLCNIDWPKEKLEIYLACEADDKATIYALESYLELLGAPHITVLKVPPSLPRTKPKALNFALPLCKGEFVVVYDAEDRPHPKQLKEAFHAFQKGPRNLACLQAPLSSPITMKTGFQSYFLSNIRHYLMVCYLFWQI